LSQVGGDCDINDGEREVVGLDDIADFAKQGD